MAERPEAMTDDELQAIVATAVSDAVDFIDSEITPGRVVAQRYADGLCDLGVEEGRSTTVRTVVRDTIRAIKPSLQRIFASADKACEFIPIGPEDQQTAMTATMCINQIFDECGSFSLLDDAFQDALVKKVGILKAFYEDTDHQTIHDYTGLDEAAYNYLNDDPELELLSEVRETSIQMGPEGVEVEVPSIEARFARTKRTGQIKVVSIPPEEFFVNRDSRSLKLDEFYVCGHRTEMRVGDVVAMGYDFDDVADLTGLSDGDDMRDLEKSTRRGYSNTDGADDDAGRDISMKLVAITEAYMRCDPFSTGIPSLYKFVLGGGNYKMLSAEPCDQVPFAIFEVNPEPHTFFGHSVPDLIMDDQDAATSILRSILDNTAMVNTPRLAIDSNSVNTDDVLNNEVGAVIRARGNPGSSISPITVPFVAGQTLPALQYLDQMVETKTGVKSDSQLHPDSLQSTTAIAVQAQMQSAAMQIETMARHLAEGGLTQLFKLLLNLFISHTDTEKMMRMNNTFQRIDPKSWNASMDVKVNVGLGTGREDEKRMALQQTMQFQQTFLQTMGPQNPLVSLSQLRNTMADMLTASGVQNVDRYFKPLTMEMEQQMAAQQAQQAQQAQAMAAQQPDPNMLMMQMEQQKSAQKNQVDMAKLQLDAAKMQADQKHRDHQLHMEDDLARDKMVADIAIRVAQTLGQYGTAVDVAEIKREQDAARTMNGGYSDRDMNGYNS